MQEEELKSYKGLKKQGALLLCSPKYGLVVVSTKLPNPTVTFPFRIPVTTREYLYWQSSIEGYYKEPNIWESQIEYYLHETISDKLSEVIISRLQ